jgi:hypothetical protein
VNFGGWGWIAYVCWEVVSAYGASAWRSDSWYADGSTMGLAYAMLLCVGFVLERGNVRGVTETQALVDDCL